MRIALSTILSLSIWPNSINDITIMSYWDSQRCNYNRLHYKLPQAHNYLIFLIFNHFNWQFAQHKKSSTSIYKMQNNAIFFLLYLSLFVSLWWQQRERKKIFITHSCNAMRSRDCVLSYLFLFHEWIFFVCSVKWELNSEIGAWRTTFAVNSW